MRPGALLFFSTALALNAGALAGQDPVPQRPDTTAQDTTEAPPPPPATLPDLDPVGPAGWEVGVWEWDRAALMRLPDVSVLDLLERVPGITPVRVGIAGQPEGAAVLGTAAGGVRYIVDGFSLDPLTTPTFDPSRLSLLALARVRVERRITGAVVRIETLSATDARAQSVVEAATGDIGINLFRGIFLAPRALGGSVALGFERLSSEAGGGSGRNIGWAKWTFVRDSAGVQLEYRQSEVDRTGFYGGFLGQRRDWAIRARGRLLGVAAEAYGGATTVEDDDGELEVHEGSPQAGIRLHRSLGGLLPVEARLAVRFRDHPRLPRTEAALEVWAAPADWLGVGADISRAGWADREPTGQLTARARLGPTLGLSLFGEATLGDSPAEHVVGGSAPGFSPVREGLRFGASFDRWGLHLGGAALRMRSDPVAGFGVAFDPAAPRFPGGDVSGVEALVRLPTGWDPLHLEGWYLGVDEPDGWLYLPSEQWKAALQYHHLPLPSGNLEIYARAEHVFRGPMATPCTSVLACSDTQDGVADGRVVIGSFTSTNLELTIRVITVRAFLRWENILHRPFQQDLPFGYPGRPFGPNATADFLALPGQHFVYGVKWEFWN